MREYARYGGPGWQKEPESEANISANSIGWLLLGIGTGAGLALLLTPSTGRELRSALASGYRRTIDGVSRGARQLRQHGSNLIAFNRRPNQQSQRG
ncbi:MAG TPA: YtxH domain-containing protein [Candidatus Angelobacter sp.]|jgi:gas vesicle protein|nr:YtxH domain-containing protein [Candidatus Angelobacter sp.]